MFSELEDGSVINKDKKFLFFSTERFLEEIVGGNCCIVCGCKRTAKSFNDEHVLPQWILRKFDLFGKQFILPNGSCFTYGRYTIPCCVECNKEIAQALEDPLSRLMAQGLKGVSSYLRNDSPWMIFTWLALIFFKVHYKDRDFRHLLDRREESPSISNFYDWTDLHHVHCIARSFYTSCVFEKSVLGTLLVLPAKTDFPDDFPLNQPFDFLTLYKSQSILLKLGDVAFIAILNDSRASLNLCRDYLSKIRGPLSTLQLRELLAVLSNVNLCLKNRPRFGSRFNHELEHYSIFSDASGSIEIENPPPDQYGTILHYCCQEFIPFINNEFDINIENYLKEGRWSFLFDQDGKFVANSL
jgi:hypothetical protein